MESKVPNILKRIIYTIFVEMFLTVMLKQVLNENFQLFKEFTKTYSDS